MKQHSRHIIHIGINFITAPVTTISAQSALQFQQALLKHGLEYSNVAFPENKIIVVRETPAPLEINIVHMDPQIGQVLIVSPQPKGSIDLFIQEAEAVVDAFMDVWPAPNRQIIKSDATIRELYETTNDHAFRELWEKRLNQPAESLKAFQRPIRGGGLRFVLEPLPEEQNPAGIEVKVESFLRDTSKLFVETQFIWPQPTVHGTSFDVRDRLQKVNEYIENQVQTFIFGEIK